MSDAAAASDAADAATLRPRGSPRLERSRPSTQDLETELDAVMGAMMAFSSSSTLPIYEKDDS